jgi:hypothetical protein
MCRKKVRIGKFEFCFSYQVSKTFRDSKYRLKNSLDMCLSNKKISWKNIDFSRRCDFFTWLVMDGSTYPLWFKLKEVPKTTFQEKNSNFWPRHSFFMNFFLLDKYTSQEGIATKILYLVTFAAQVREAKWNGNDTFWQCCFASRTKWVRRCIIQGTT